MQKKINHLQLLPLSKAMDLFHKFMNTVAPPTSLFLLLLFLLFKFLLSILRSFFCENVAGKVVLITGASSGIGEHLAYEYAKRGACLVLVARREKRLREVANRARAFGSPDVVVVCADVSKVDDCKRTIDEAMNHFGRLDYLVNNAGIISVCMLEDSPEITNFKPVMDINFWGSVYTTYFAAPHLRKSKGKIVVIASSAGWVPVPRMSIYNASKAALISFYETLRNEFWPDIRITIVTPGFVESEMTQGKYLTKEGVMGIDQELRDVKLLSPLNIPMQLSNLRFLFLFLFLFFWLNSFHVGGQVQVSAVPVVSADGTAKAVVDSACRGDRYLTVPWWFGVTFLWKMFSPEVLDWFLRLLYVTGPGISERDAISKKILELTGAKKFLYPASIQSPELKAD
ncbi:hypothetical protein HHK36_015874 [Tetracentron sinense]|uniref:Uncharacterized protein n=1 Tax=Tetracentron sinense TaxID=13715 RepID=A0A834Z6Y4_TETSI|nr:hypothetical protein HHK36_015874 [Tetracentron sinense]